MSLPTFQPDIAPAIRREIDAKLAEIAATHDVRVVFAVESGSRAWGFPSPDSDYDARFVYVHKPDWYLSLRPGRDVIELPISGDLDVSGWDLRKALNLLLKPNPVMLEWLSSPIRYAWNAAWCDRLVAVAKETTHGPACLYHYLHLGDGQWSRHVVDKLEVNYKKYFYVLRPALAIRWIRLGHAGPPPMNLHDLVDGIDLDPETTSEIARLLELKRQAREIGTGPRNALLDRLIESEFEFARNAPVTAEPSDLRSRADALFRDIVKG